MPRDGIFHFLCVSPHNMFMHFLWCSLCTPCNMQKNTVALLRCIPPRPCFWGLDLSQAQEVTFSVHFFLSLFINAPQPCCFSIVVTSHSSALREFICFILLNIFYINLNFFCQFSLLFRIALHCLLTWTGNGHFCAHLINIII